jgi:hypothetical protein
MVLATGEVQRFGREHADAGPDRRQVRGRHRCRFL